MNTSEELLKSFEELPHDKQIQIINFVKFLKMKGKQEISKIMDTVINENIETLEELS